MPDGMALEEAIKTLTPLLREFRPRLNSHERHSLKLGIEALKHRKDSRLTDPTSDQNLLPGETPE